MLLGLFLGLIVYGATGSALSALVVGVVVTLLFTKPATR